MRIILVMVFLLSLMPFSAKAQQAPGNALLAALITAANTCIRDDLTASPPKGTLIEYWLCLGLARQVYDIRGWYGISRPGAVPELLDAAVTATHAAEELVRVLWMSDGPKWKRDVIELLNLSDSYVGAYTTKEAAEAAQDGAGAPSRRYDTMVAAALGATSRCLTRIAKTIQSSLGPGAEWSMGQCYLLIVTMTELLAKTSDLADLPPDLRVATATLQQAAAIGPDMVANGWDTDVAADVLVLTIQADVQIAAWESWTCAQEQSDIYPCPWSPETGRRTQSGTDLSH